MNSIVDTVLTGHERLTRRQRLIAGVVLVLVVSGTLAVAMGWLTLAAALLLILQAVGIVLVVLSQRQLTKRLNAGLSRLSTQVKRPPGKAGLTLRRFSALRYYAKANSAKRSNLVQQLVLDRSLDGRDILAYQATKGRLDFDAVRSLLEAFRRRDKREKVRLAAKRFDCNALLALARTLYRQEASAADLVDAITLYSLIVAAFKRSVLEISDMEWMVCALVQERRFEEALKWLDNSQLSPDSSDNYHLLRANVLNPFIEAAHGQDEQAWLDCINRGYATTGLQNVALLPGDEAPFFRLSANCVAGSVDGPLISVIMPVYMAQENIRTAIGSVLGQTWKNLELILVDDGSPAEHHAVLAEWARLDSRVKLIQCPVNRGTYTVRNIGLQAASGEFVTCHDTDDWSHPQMLEWQARHLIGHPDVIANAANMARVRSSLEICHRHPGRTLLHMAMCTLMFRRAEVLERIGFWDTVRKMGDAEFIRRMELVFGQKIESVAEQPLLFALQDEASLSGSDMLRGFMNPERQLYRTRYREWHRRIEAGEASPLMAIDMKDRPFPAPASFLPVRVGRQTFDVLFVSELGFTGGNVHSLIHEMEICLEAGLKVGLVNVHNLLFTHLAMREPIPALVDLVVSGRVTEISLTTPADATMAIVRWPACFEYTSSLPSGIRAERVVVVANHPPYEGHQDRHSYEMGRVSRNVARTFGVEPKWAPQSATIRRMLAPQLPRRMLLDVDWIAVLAEAPARPRRREKPVADVPVIGRHSRDHHLKWPGRRETLLKIYPSDGSVKVRALGGVDTVVASGALQPEDIVDWDVLPFGSMPPLDFLQSIDFFVYYHHKDWVEAFGRVIMEAMFAGAVVVLPRIFEPVFGDAAVYAEPNEVQALIRSHYDDWSLFQAQSDRGIRYAYGNCTPAAYRRRLANLGVDALHSELDVESA